MKRLILITLAVFALSAHSQIVTRDQAQVTGVTPIVEQVRQPGQCRQIQSHRQQQSPNVGQAILGGIVGGAVGSQFGQGQGRDAMIAAGSALGAVWGSGQPQSGQMQQQCDSDTLTERVRGYRVTYVYQGYTGTTMMTTQPGSSIPVVISVTADAQPQQQYQPQYQQQYQPQPQQYTQPQPRY